MGKRKDVTCQVCGRKIPYTEAVHSKPSGNSYCKDGLACRRAVEERDSRRA